MSPDQRVFPTLLIILDGFGYSEKTYGNAIAHANMPTLTMLKQKYPWTTLQPSGRQVGLLDGYIGNSEVGHLTIGAGRIIPSVLKKFHEAINNDTFFTFEPMLTHLQSLKKTNKTLHLMGLLSDAGVHSHEFHLHALLRFAKKIGIEKVIIHAFLDGRDVAPQSAALYLERLNNVCSSLEIGTIGSLHGRFYAMDRDKNHDRTNISFDTLTKEHSITYSTWQEALQASYQHNITDEFFYPQQLTPNVTIQQDDGVIFFNFRPDRARQLTELFLTSADTQNLAFFITTTRYKKTFANPVLFQQEVIEHTLLDEIAHQKPQEKIFVIAESEKYAHVSYFFRGMREEQFPHEQQILVPSIKTKNYNQHPEMSAQVITDRVIASITNDPAYFYLINYANADMVGHSGDFDACIKACEFLDQQLAQLYKTVVLEHGGTIFITADHGNIEAKIDQVTHTPLTAHTTNPVIFLAIGKAFEQKLESLIINSETSTHNHGYGLAQIAPTILHFLELSIPKNMSQEILL